MSQYRPSGFAKVPIALTLDSRLKDADKVLYGLLKHFAYAHDRWGKPWPSREEIAQQLGKGDSTVGKSLHTLEYCGWIVIHRRGTGQRWRCIEVYDQCLRAELTNPPYGRSRSKTSGKRACSSSKMSGNAEVHALENERSWLPELADLPAETMPKQSIYAGAERSEDTAPPTACSAGTRAMDDVVTHNGRGPANDDTDDIHSAGATGAYMDGFNSPGKLSASAPDDDPWGNVPAQGVDKWTA
jgi:hypothetical protein